MAPRPIRMDRHDFLDQARSTLDRLLSALDVNFTFGRRSWFCYDLNLIVLLAGTFESIITEKIN